MLQEERRNVAKHISASVGYKKNGGLLNQLQMHEYVLNLRIPLSLSTLTLWTLGVDIFVHLFLKYDL